FVTVTETGWVVLSFAPAFWSTNETRMGIGWPASTSILPTSFVIASACSVGRGFWLGCGFDCGHAVARVANTRHFASRDFFIVSFPFNLFCAATRDWQPPRHRGTTYYLPVRRVTTEEWACPLESRNVRFRAPCDAVAVRATRNCNGLPGSINNGRDGP